MTDHVTALFLLIDGEEYARIMHRGDREGCEYVRDNLHAVAHSGPGTVTDSRLVVMPHDEFTMLVEDTET